MAINRIDGLETVLGNINREVGVLKHRTIGGLFAGGLIVQRTSQQRTPVDTGNLKASAYTRKALGGQLSVEVGYTAAYAVNVHENMEQKLKGEPRAGGTGKGNYWDSGRPKFLESSLRDNESEVIDAVARHARVDK